jgi:hypothetical protein
MPDRIDMERVAYLEDKLRGFLTERQVKILRCQVFDQVHDISKATGMQVGSDEFRKYYNIGRALTYEPLLKDLNELPLGDIEEAAEILFPD